MFSSHVSVTYVKLCLCTNLWEPVWDSLVQKSWRQQFFTVKAFRMWHEAILFVHCKECSLSSVASQHVFCVVLQMISSFLFCSCANVWVRMWEYAYVLLSILYDGLWVQVCACVCVFWCVLSLERYPASSIVRGADRWPQGHSSPQSVTLSGGTNTHKRDFIPLFFLFLLWIASIPRSSPLLLPSVSTLLCSLVICTYLFLLHTSYSPLCGITFSLFFASPSEFFFFTISNFALPSYVVAPFSLELMTSVQTIEIIVLTRFLWRPHAISDTIFETYCVVELAQIKRFLFF